MSPLKSLLRQLRKPSIKPRPTPTAKGTTFPPSSSRRPPIVVQHPIGTISDDLDAMDLTEAFEDPGRWEDTILRAHSEAKNEPDLAALLKLFHLQADRAEAFADFCASGTPEAIARLVARFGITKESPVCDLGCGAGHLAYSPHRQGYQRVSAMDPNSGWHGGTGYLRSVVGEDIEIINDLADWRATIGKFDAIISQATVHHWQHIPLVSLDTRRTLKPGGSCFVTSEWFSNSPLDRSSTT